MRSHEKIFREALGNDKLNVKLENLKDAGVSVLLENSEEGQRMNDMARLYGMAELARQNDQTLVVNANSPLVAHLLASENEELVKKAACQMYDLARLSSRPLEAAELNAFISRTQELLDALIGG